MSVELPRVLFCTSEIPQSVNAGSMQLYRVLEGYPGERLMVLGMPPEKDARLLPCRYEPLQLITYRLACTRFRQWTSGLNALNTFLEPQLGRSVALVRPFSPDLIVTVMDKLSYYKHAWALSRRLNVPLMTVTMDDPQTFERAHPLLEGAFVGFLRRLYGDAALSLGVSREMCDYLATRFGKPSTMFHFGPPPGIAPRAAEESRSLKSPPRLTLGYAGSLGLGYRDGLLRILDTLAATETTLNLYTRDQHNLIDHPSVVNRGFLPPEALWPTVQRECDAVLLQYAYDGPMQRVYRTHFPTKLSEYCWVGMPIVVAGPAYATGVRWAKRHPEVAMAATEPGVESLGAALQQLRAAGARRAAMAAAGARIAVTQFDPVSIRSQFHQLLCQGAASKRTTPARVAA